VIVCWSSCQTAQSRLKSAGWKVTRRASSRRQQHRRISMKSPIARWIGACAALLLCSASWSALGAGAPPDHHMLWSLQGKTNKVDLLGSIHLLKATETLPAAIDAAYADAQALLMEIDMDDLDQAKMQQDGGALAMQT